MNQTASAPPQCAQCATVTVTAELTESEYGPLCLVCAFRQDEHDQACDTFQHLTPSSFGFLSDTE